MTNTAKEEISRWRAQGVAIRRLLVEERKQVAARLADIDRDLAGLPEDPEEPAGQVRSVLQPKIFPVPDGEISIPAMVSQILRHSEVPLSAGEIVERVQNSRTGVKPEMIHSAIYRLKERGEIIYKGDKGSRVFFWGGGPPGSHGG